MPSTVIAAIHYDPAGHVLTIVYRGKRGVYHYFDVPPEEYVSFRAAASKGTYLNEIFKPKGYKFERQKAYADG